MARQLALSGMLLLVLALVGCDHATKRVAAAHLAPDGAMALVPGVVELRYVENQDTAFSLTRAWSPRVKVPALAAASLVGMLGVWALLKQRLPRAGALERLSLALLAAGAIGNVLDRFRLGYVVDFIHVQHWPVFNVADVLIVVGAILLALQRTRGGPRQDAASPSA